MTTPPHARPDHAVEPASEGASPPRSKTKPSAEEQQRVLLHMPVDVRSVSLALVAVIASAFALQWAKEVVIPILLGIMFSYALKPLVDRMRRLHIPAAASAGLLLTAIVAGVSWSVWSLGDDASALVETLPQAAQKLRQSIEGKRQQQVSTIERMQQAAAEFERATEEGPGSAASSASGSVESASAVEPMSAALPPTPRGVTRVMVEKPRLDIKDYLWTGTLGIVGFLGQVAVVFFITFFLLASGDSFRRKMVKLAGPRLSQKRITVQALDEISSQVQRYLLVQAGVSVLVGVATWLIFLAIGLEHSAVWGVAAAITNLIPYVGSVLIGGSSALVGFIQFGSIETGLFIGASSFAIHAVVGNLLTPWWMGRASRMSPFAVFVSVLVFGWLWGVWGLLLGVPILMVVKTVCDRIDDLKPIGELLGD